MAIDRILLLKAEVSTLTELLNELAVDQLIERMGFEDRLAAVQDELQVAIAAPTAKPLPITFHGVPVDSSRSIDANFASSAMKAFGEAVDAVAVVPRNSRNQRLRIVSTAVGSFGFNLELAPVSRSQDGQRTLLPEPPPVDAYADAIANTLKLMHVAAASDQDATVDLIAEIPPKAASKVRQFAEILSEHKAGFTAEFEGKRIKLDAGLAVERVLSALTTENISETEEPLTGKLLGILPNSRKFEFALADGRVVSGKADASVEDPFAFSQQWQNVETTMRFRVVAVAGRRRYSLLGVSGNPAGATQ